MSSFSDDDDDDEAAVPIGDNNNLQPFFVLRKAMPSSSSSPSASSSRSRARRRIIDASPTPKSHHKSNHNDGDGDDDDDDDAKVHHDHHHNYYYYDQLRLQAFDLTWSNIHSTIKEVLRDINLKLFDEVLQWVLESFAPIQSKIKTTPASEIQRPYPLLTDAISRKIPTAFILSKNAEFVDDIQTFQDLGGHLKSNGCHLANLSALDLSSNHGVAGCVRSLSRQLLSEAPPDVADIHVLASWYHEPDNCDRPIIVIVDDLERCSGDVLGELIMMLSEWAIKIPIYFVMGIATTLDAPRKRLSSDALQRLQPCKLTLGSPSDRMNALVEAVLVKPCTGFCIGHRVAVFLRNYFLRHDGTITSFISALKLACSKHFSLEPLSFFCMGMLEEDSESYWHEKFDALPQSMRKYAFDLPSCKRDNTLLQTGDDIVQGLSQLKKLQKVWSSALLCLFEAGRHNKLQLLDIFCEASDPNQHSQRASDDNCLAPLVAGENLLRGKLISGKGGFISQAINAVRELPMDLLSHVLKMWSLRMKGMNEIRNKVKELQSFTASPEGGRITRDKWTKRSASLSTGKGTSLNDKAAMLLDGIVRKFLIPIECTPFHEIFCFKHVDTLQSALIGDPRRRIQLDLLKSQSYLQCYCCSRVGSAVSASMHDTSIIYNLTQEYGDVINLHDWYLSFKEVVSTTNPRTKRKTHHSPSKKKSKSAPLENEAMIQARFCRAVTELQVTGLLRMPSKRRPDFVQRTAFGL